MDCVERLARISRVVGLWMLGIATFFLGLFFAIFNLVHECSYD